jgi:K+-sensing histidine kinase KdpD
MADRPLVMMRPPSMPLAVSAAALVVVVALRWLLDPILGDTMPLVTLYGAVALSVWVGGWRHAAPVALLGYMACNVLFIQPRGALSLNLRPRSSASSPTRSPAR